VEVRVADVVQVDPPDDAHAERGDAAAVVVEPIRLQHHHVAAVAAAPVEEATRGRRRGDRRHDLEERVADRHDGVDEPELPDARVAE
jgi:hypothetical protein